jgi:hypothetical protein
MGGLVIDTFLFFFVKGTLRFFWYITSRSWERIPAIIVHSAVMDHSYLGCPEVMVSYQIGSNSRLLQGTAKIPFLAHEDARSYAKRFSEKLPVTVRLDPHDPQHTLLFIRDQKFAPLS